MPNERGAEGLSANASLSPHPCRTGNLLLPLSPAPFDEPYLLVLGLSPQGSRHLKGEARLSIPSISGTLRRSALKTSLVNITDKGQKVVEMIGEKSV